MLAECGRFLATLRDVRAVPVPDTGIAARDVAAAKDPTRAAIASSDAGRRYGLVELANTISDHPENYSRFLLFRAPNARGVAADFEPATDYTVRKTSLVFAVPDQPGALGRCLTIFGDNGLNVSKLDSKSRLGAEHQFAFYADVDGDIREERFANALQSLRGVTATLHVIGSYDAATAPPRERVTTTVTVDEAPPKTPAPAKNSWKVTRRDPARTARVHVGPVTIGDGHFVVVGGPCSVETREQILATAEAVRSAGAVMLRGGVFKPRTSPYSFQGLGWEGMDLLAEAGRAVGVPIVSEVMTIDRVGADGRRRRHAADRRAQHAKLRSAQSRRPNRSAGLAQTRHGREHRRPALGGGIHPVEGNPNVVLCERGIRTFETATRNTLDLSAIPVLRERTHLPIMVDPSHGVGVRRWIVPLCCAAKAVGAHGLLVEVHPNPAEALSDSEQALTFNDFSYMMHELAQVPVTNDHVR